MARHNLSRLAIAILGSLLPAPGAGSAPASDNPSSSSSSSTTTTSISTVSSSTVSSPINLETMEAPNYLTALNETVVDYNTVVVRDYDDADVTYSLTYTISSQGDVITYGDIVWGSEQLLRELTVYDYSNNTARAEPKKRFYSEVSWAWPHATVIYRYDSCETKQALGALLEAGMAEWKSLAPYLNFVELAPLNTFTPGVLLVTKAEPTNPWCWSNAGFWNGADRLRMNLQLYTNPDPVTGLMEKSCGFSHATVMHELGHQLGMMHEQQRPDAASTVKFHCENFYDNECPTSDCCRDSKTGEFPLKDSGIGRCCAGVEAFEPRPNTPSQILGKPYDIDSIVEYPYWASAKAYEKPTLTLLKDGTPIPDNNGKVSKGDLEALCEFYKEYCDAWKDANQAGGGCADGKCVQGTETVIDPDPGSSTSCGTCDPTAGKNKCHPSASCTNTGTEYHCMCRAGYKAAGSANSDVTKHFRLPWTNFEQIVFVAEGVECTQLCDFPHGISPQLCSEVPTQWTCPV
ncbi:hypothetical protein BX600DRAFT_515551 [Xylariales sp. PMI_506]|nr:hypothetical protein BX600DRAFT_515551 [Xylariales sp. PMI_506]